MQLSSELHCSALAVLAEWCWSEHHVTELQVLRQYDAKLLLLRQYQLPIEQRIMYEMAVVMVKVQHIAAPT